MIPFHPSPLFRRIVKCSNAIRNRSDTKDSSYQEVMQHLPCENNKDEGYTDTELVKASLAFLKKPFVASGADDRKANVAMYIATLLADDRDKSDLAKEICDRFGYLDDFDRPIITSMFKFVICNKRACDLLDRVMVKKEKNMTPHILHHFHVEFVEIFFNIMEIVVCREESESKQALADLGYTSNVTKEDMATARAIIDKHLDDIATKCSACFKPDVLTLSPDKTNHLFPKGGGLPRVSIGRKHVEGSEATTDLLKESLVDKDEKGEFLEMMFAAISHASNPLDPVLTYRRLHLESVKEFFLEKMLDKAEAEDTRKAVLASDEARDLHHQIKSMAEKISAMEKDNVKLREELSCSREELTFVQKRLMESGDICRKFAKQIPALKEKSNDLERENKRIKISLALTEKNEKALRQDRELFTRKKMTRKQEADMMWDNLHAGHGLREKSDWSGDELDE